MRFEIRPPHVVFHDTKPGQHAQLSVSRVGQAVVNYPFNGNASSFSDKKKQYAWAFDGDVQNGDQVVFSTEDRSVMGTVVNGAIELEGAEKAGKPKASSKEERPRPTPMKAPKKQGK